MAIWYRDDDVIPPMVAATELLRHLDAWAVRRGHRFSALREHTLKPIRQLTITTHDPITISSVRAVAKKLIPRIAAFSPRWFVELDLPPSSLRGAVQTMNDRLSVRVVQAEHPIYGLVTRFDVAFDQNRGSR